MQRYSSRPKALQALRKILRNPEHPDFPTMYRWVSEQGWGKATQKVEHGGKVGLESILAASWEVPE